MKKITFIMMIFLFGVIFLNTQVYCKEIKNKDSLYEQIRQCTNSHVLESGFNISIIEKNNHCNIEQYINKLKCYSDDKINIIVNKSKQNDSLVFNIKIYSYKDIQKVKTLEKEMNSYLINNGHEDCICSYVKLKTSKQNLTQIKNKITDILIQNHSRNIETIKLDNGFTGVAYTNTSCFMKVNQKKIDFNYAVCKYNSGNYIIIGSPQISITY